MARPHKPLKRQPRKSTAPKERPLGAIRLNARMRDMGLASRREADELIEAGRVTVNGTRAVIGTLVTESDRVELSGARKALRYEAYHKPRGLPTQGEAGEASVVTKAKAEGLFPVGRLDKDSSGLLILTNDGRATTTLIGEDSDIEKEYLVTTKEPIRSGIPDIFAKGMLSPSLGQLRPASAAILGERKIRITLTEGKRHQVRVMLSDLGLTVADLVRTRIGGVLLGKLKAGQTRALTPVELSSLGLSS